MSATTMTFWPMIAQTALIYVIYLIGSNRRMAAIRNGETQAKDYLVPNVEPASSATAIRNLSNQFELPVLFYVVCLSLYITHGAGLVAVVLAWVFVASRVVHAYVHVTSNDLRIRRPVFIFGFFVVGAMWIWLALRLLAA
ncbi:MAPEG family protein [Pararhizobium mangrovi]|uniref:MAPEG family protein n=1 Tax=Pararhizobium mangrovi TaxID=2590452 RepID=A0A506U0V4_9HYPH|nr:MAPEG family protein [Pararhizobium mangrovi]TPW27400.1 hypothetical protein FJU11_11570 [Pararhizobium mangrovi]